MEKYKQHFKTINQSDIIQSTPALTIMPTTPINLHVDNKHALKLEFKLVLEDNITIKTESPVIDEVTTDQLDYVSGTKCDPDFIEDKPPSPQDDETFRCVYCDFASAVLPVFERHVETEHIADAGFEIRPGQVNFSLSNDEVIDLSSSTDDSNASINNDEDAIAVDGPRHLLMVVNRETNVYQCKECSFISEEEHDLKEHTRVSHNLRRDVHRGASCIYSTASRTDLSRHLKNNHERNTKKKKRLLVERAKSVEAKKRTTYPKTRYTLFRSAKKNDRIAHDRYKCNHCGYASKWVYCLYFHLRTAHIGEYTGNVCTACRYTAANRTDLCRHLTNKHQRGVIDCPQCSYVCSSATAMNVHRKVVHQQLHRCQFCEYISNKKADLIRHGWVHQPVLYKCRFCAVKTKHPVSLERHVRRAHSSSSSAVDVSSLKVKYVCEHCGWLCKSEHSRTVHMRRVHSFDADQQQIPLQFIVTNSVFVNISKKPMDNVRYRTTSEHTSDRHVRIARGSGLDTNKRNGDGCVDKSVRGKSIASKNHQSVIDIDLYDDTTCDYTVTSRQRVSEQARRHNDSVVTKYDCGFCKFTAKSTAVLDLHVKRTHAEEREAAVAVKESPLSEESVVRCDAVSTLELDDAIGQMDDRREDNSCRSENETRSVGQMHCARSKANSKCGKNIKKCNVRRVRSNLQLKTLRTGADDGLKRRVKGKCEKRYNTRSRVESVKVETHRCIHCNFRCVTKYNLTMHMEKKHSFSIRRGLSRRKRDLHDNMLHTSINHDVDTRIYRCSKCDWTTTRNTYLNDHMTAAHPNSTERAEQEIRTALVSSHKVYRCSICKYSARYKSTFIKHAKVHLLDGKCSPVLRDHIDDGMDSGASDKGKFSGKAPLHTQSKHSCKDDDNKQTKCPVCEYSTDDQILFKKHITRHIL